MVPGSGTVVSATTMALPAVSLAPITERASKTVSKGEISPMANEMEPAPLLINFIIGLSHSGRAGSIHAVRVHWSYFLETNRTKKY